MVQNGEIMNEDNLRHIFEKDAEVIEFTDMPSTDIELTPYRTDVHRVGDGKTTLTEGQRPLTGEEKYQPSLGEAFKNLSKILANFCVDIAVGITPAAEALKHLAVEIEATAAKDRQRSRQDLQNKRRAARGGKYKPF